jgi:group I intron endonuclease
VGSAKVIRARWRGHLRALLSGTNTKKLQRAWDKYGAAEFAFHILMLCHPDELLGHERRMIAALSGVSTGFNCRSEPASNLGIKFGPPSDETRRLIGAKNAVHMLGRPGPMRAKRHSEASRQKQRETRRSMFRRIEFNGESLCLSDWADRLGIHSRTLSKRFKIGWSVERALTAPLRPY